MNKIQFLMVLQDRLCGLPQEDIEERLNFYGEMIDDRVEEGLSEEEAVADVGDVDQIVDQILQEVLLIKIVKEKITPKRKLKVLEIILLSLGSPIWVSLLIAALAVIFSLYVSLWSVIVSLWSVFVALCACFLGSLGNGIFLMCSGNGAAGAVYIGASLVCAGLTVFFFMGCKLATKGTIRLTKKIVLWVKGLFTGKEDQQ